MINLVTFFALIEFYSDIRDSTSNGIKYLKKKKSLGFICELQSFKR